MWLAINDMVPRRKPDGEVKPASLRKRAVRDAAKRSGCAHIAHTHNSSQPAVPQTHQQSRFVLLPGVHYEPPIAMAGWMILPQPMQMVPPAGPPPAGPPPAGPPPLPPPAPAVRLQQDSVAVAPADPPRLPQTFPIRCDHTDGRQRECSKKIASSAQEAVENGALSHWVDTFALAYHDEQQEKKSRAEQRLKLRRHYPSSKPHNARADSGCVFEYP